MCSFRKKDVFCPRFGTYIWCQERDLNPRPPAYETRDYNHLFSLEVYLKLLKYILKVVAITTKNYKKLQKTTKIAKCGYLNLKLCSNSNYLFTTLIAELLPSNYLARTIIYLCVCLIKQSNFIHADFQILQSNQSNILGTHISRLIYKIYGGVKCLKKKQY